MRRLDTSRTSLCKNGAVAKTKTKTRAVRGGLLWTLWGTGIAGVITLFAYSSISRFGVIALCSIAATAFICAVAEHGWLWKAPSSLGSSIQFFGKLIRAIAIISLIVGVMTWIGIEIYPPIRRHTLSHDERETFKNFLKGKADDKYQIQIACPLNDEKTCSYATQFLGLFGESGWKVSTFVQRIMLSRSLDGVHVRLRGGNKESMMQHWDAGAYYPINEIHVLAVHSAFQSIAIEIDGSSDPDLPENQMMIYVGPERDNEAEPTDLTRDIEWVTGKRIGPFPTPTK